MKGAGLHEERVFSVTEEDDPRAENVKDMAEKVEESSPEEENEGPRAEETSSL
ncbi:MAG: hypothetical protein GXO55_01455 [Chloroflexi bacterium]|nr:hypothetical protein [Chloroflexota bacterium]